MPITVEELDELARELARLHRELVTLSPQKRFHLISKSTTIADVELEAAFGEAVQKRLGRDTQIFGEEAVSSNRVVRTGGSATLYLDAIDGTRLFVEGRSDYACTFAIEEAGRLVGGCVYLPGTDERFIARPGESVLYRNGRPVALDRRFRNRRAAVRERDFADPRDLRRQLEKAHFVVFGLGSTARRLCEVANWDLAGFSKTVGFTNGTPRLWGIAGGLVLCEAAGHQFWFDPDTRVMAIGRAELVETIASVAAPGLCEGSLDALWQRMGSTMEAAG